jgi:hypothetical protein
LCSCVHHKINCASPAETASCWHDVLASCNMRARLRLVV